MALFLISFLVMALAVLAMSVGVIVSKKPLKGSCGGLSSLGIERACDCPNPCAKRRKTMAGAGASEVAPEVIRFR